MFFVLLIHPNSIIPIHIDRAVGKAIIMWAVGVNVNGDRAIKLIIRREKKVIIIVLLTPFWLYGFIRETSSLLSGIVIELEIISHLKFLFFLF